MEWLRWAILGGAISIWIVIHIITDHPPPDITGKLWGIVVAGMVGAVLGAVLFGESAAGSDPMPLRTLIGVLATALFVSGAATVVFGFGQARGQR